MQKMLLLVWTMTTNENNSPRSAKRRVKHTRMDAAILEFVGPCGGQQRTTEQCLFKKKKKKEVYVIESI